MSVIDKSCLQLKVKYMFFVTYYIFYSYYFSVFKLDDFEKAQRAIYMFKDLFGLSKLDADNLIRFTLTVRKNYRRVPYHNWAHGFSVANSMYSVIRHSQDTFQANEVSINR
jgi:cAMP and cAMP-inhibited cGMP 3',5'-cyclic phosphodiesterase 10